MLKSWCKKTKYAVFAIMGYISMGSIFNIVVIDYHCVKFGAFNINSTIISPF